MATNDWHDIETNDYDLYDSQGSPSALPGTPDIDPSGHLIIPDQAWFPPSTIENSTMDEDPNNTGPMTQFWEHFPISIDMNGFIFYYGENTGINLRGPEGAPKYIRYEDLTPEEIASLKGQDGVNGLNGRDGADGVNGVDGLDAYHVWLRDMGYDEQDHPVEEFYTYIAGYAETLIREGEGEGSIIANYGGTRNTAGGDGSFATGDSTSAGGRNSFTAGLGTRAPYSCQFAIGSYNLGDSTNVFEIGSGNSVTRKNCFSVTPGGHVTSSGDIEDGYGNLLSNKVDKIAGKSLSTNDFSNTYKAFIDNYRIESTIIQGSMNPVTGGAIYNALQDVVTSITSKPTIRSTSEDRYIPILSYTPVDEDEYLEQALKINDILWNPSSKNLKIGYNNNNDTSTYTYNYLFGQGLVSGANDQFIIGKYNNTNSVNAFEIGNGTSNNRRNILSLTKQGNLIVAGSITDGYGNVLSGKQDLLQYDLIPTQFSTNVMTSDAIYNTLMDVGITPGEGIYIPQLNSLQTQVNTLNSSLIAVSGRVTNIENTIHEITDDLTQDVYILGISNGELYIRLKNDPEPEPEPEDDDEEEPEET